MAAPAALVCLEERSSSFCASAAVQMPTIFHNPRCSNLAEPAETEGARVSALHQLCMWRTALPVCQHAAALPLKCLMAPWMRRFVVHLPSIAFHPHHAHAVWQPSHPRRALSSTSFLSPLLEQGREDAARCHLDARRAASPRAPMASSVLHGVVDTLLSSSTESCAVSEPMPADDDWRRL